MQKFEYKIEPVIFTADGMKKGGVNYVQSILNNAGDEGWELCCILDEKNFVFKRRIPGSS